MSFSLSTLDIGGVATPVVQAGGILYRLQDVAPSVPVAPGAGGLMSVLERWPDNEPVLVEAVGRRLAAGRRGRRAASRQPGAVADTAAVSPQGDLHRL